MVREISTDGTTPVARVLIRSRGALWRLLVDPLFQFSELYSKGQLEIDGDLLDLMNILYRALFAAKTSFSGSTFLHRPRGNALSRSRKNIHHHYDIGNDFYELWLDESRNYTCAYFTEPYFTLEQAQLAKMDHVCRKLGLQRGERVLEAGCGWGMRALHMARHYGVQVKAFSLSHEQILYARWRAKQEGLQDTVEYIEDDWRNISQPCDAFVSVGMLEHVGRKNYRHLGDVIHNCLKSSSRGLIHSIGRNRPYPLNTWIECRIFPGAYTPSLREMMEIFEPHDFSILDIENLRLHYAKTLRHWLDRFETFAETVRAMFDDRFVRMWRIYLSGSVTAFEVGSMQLFQILFSAGRNNQIPWTRAQIYEVTKTAASA